MNVFIEHPWLPGAMVVCFFGGALTMYRLLNKRINHIEYIKNIHCVPKDVIRDKVKNITTVLTHHSNDAIAGYMQAQVKGDKQSSAYHQGQFDAYQKTNQYWSDITE